MFNCFREKKFLKELLIFSVITAILHILALEFYLYWTIEWYDILMHFLGGATMAFLVVFLLFTSEYIKPLCALKHHSLIILLAIISFVLVVGLSWELWEIFVGFSDVFKDRGDTILDIIMDMLGGVAVFYYVKKRIV